LITKIGDLFIPNKKDVNERMCLFMRAHSLLFNEKHKRLCKNCRWWWRHVHIWEALVLLLLTRLYPKRHSQI